MDHGEPPEWCQWRSGRSAVLVVAPHGGRRGAHHGDGREAVPVHTSRKVNDLFSAEIAVELADVLDASLVVNAAFDRNRLDLNRISQVTTRAPWFLALLERLLGDILARHERAEILFVHGWNVVQARCDVGIGDTFATPADAADAADRLTVSVGYVNERLAALERAATAAGIAVSFGERYPGRHPNNMLQLFRRDIARASHPTLAAWVTAGRIEAVQLELGVALRWPGRPRRAFVDIVATAFADGAPRSPAPALPLIATPRTASASLQVYDPAAQIGLTIRADPAGPNGPGGRVLVFQGSRRASLFIGEPLRGAPPSEGPCFVPTADGFDVHFEGYALATDDGWRYVDLEDAFASSQLSAIRLALRFHRGATADYGMVDGCLEVDGTLHAIAAAAFARHGILQRTGNGWMSHLALLAALGPTRAVRLRHEFPGSSLVHELTDAGEVTRPAPPLAAHFGADRYAPSRIALGRELVCRPLTRMSITRPLAAHRQALITFGAAAFEAGRERGFGFYEYGTVVIGT